MSAGGVSGDATEDDAVEERVTAQTVASVDAPPQPLPRVQADDGNAVGRSHLGLVVDGETAHGVVHHGAHLRDVEDGVVHVERDVVEKLFPKGAALGRRGARLYSAKVSASFRGETPISLATSAPLPNFFMIPRPT